MSSISNKNKIKKCLNIKFTKTVKNKIIEMIGK